MTTTNMMHYRLHGVYFKLTHWPMKLFDSGYIS